MFEREKFPTLVFLVLLLSILCVSYSHQQTDDKDPVHKERKNDKENKEIKTLKGKLIEKTKWERLLEKGASYYYSEPEGSKDTRWIELVFFKKNKSSKLKPFRFKSIAFRKNPVEKKEACGTNGSLAMLEKRVFRIRFALGCEKEKKLPSKSRLGFDRTYTIRSIGGGIINKSFDIPSQKELKPGRVKYVPILIPSKPDQSEQEEKKPYTLTLNKVPLNKITQSGKGEEAKIRIEYVMKDKRISLNKISKNKYGTKETVKTGGSIFIYRLLLKSPNNRKIYDFPDGYTENKKLMYVLKNVDSDHVNFQDWKKTSSYTNETVKKRLNIRHLVSKNIKHKEEMYVLFLQSFQTGKNVTTEMPVFIFYLWKGDRLQSIPVNMIPGTYKVEISYEENKNYITETLSDEYKFPPDEK